MDYYYKYLQYKKKYFSLKEQTGGYNNCTRCVDSKPTDPCYFKKVNPGEKDIYDWGKCKDFKPKIYIPYFHSCHTEEIKQIQEGSILVNTSSCGLTTAYHERVKQTLRQMFIDKDEKLRDPVKHREYISNKLGFPISIHTSSENSNYLDMDLSYHLLSRFTGKDHTIKQLCSGLFSMDNG
jgi:hypothetical protein